MIKKIINLIIVFLIFKNVSAQDFIFETKKIEIINKGEIVNAIDGKAFSKDKNLEINGGEFKYNVRNKILEIYNGGSILIKSKNLEFLFEDAIINEKNQTIEANGEVITRYYPITQNKRVISYKGRKLPKNFFY